MGKISVFKFRLGDSADENEVKALIESYLASRGLNFDSVANVYTTGAPTKEENMKNLAKSVAVSLASAAIGGTFGHVYSKIEHCLEYQLAGNELVIKAYLNVKGKKHFIHSTFNNSPAGSNYYSDLRNVMFKALAEKGVDEESCFDYHDYSNSANTHCFWLILLQWLSGNVSDSGKGIRG